MIFTKEQIGLSKDDLEAHLKKTTHKAHMEQLNETVDPKKDMFSLNEMVNLGMSFFCQIIENWIWNK